MELLTKYKIIVIVLALLGVVTAMCSYMYFSRSRSDRADNKKIRKFSVINNNIKKLVFDNGLHVLMYKTDALPKVLVQLAYDKGSAIESERERGLAHLLEHMIFKGTKRLSESDIDAIARKYGASYNAYTAIDVTSYYFEVNKNNWEPFIDILADCMQNARFDEQHLASELKAVIQELKMNKDNYWNVMFHKAFEILFPANHPYHHPIIGYKDDLLHLTTANLRTFYEKHYTPASATLFIIGDIDEAAVEQVVREKFASIPGNKISEEYHFPKKELTLGSSRVQLYEDVTTEHLGFFCQIPGLQEMPEYVGSATAYILGDGESSRLYRALVEDKKIAHSVAAGTYELHNAGIFYVLVEPVTGKSEECRTAVRDVLQEIASSGVTTQELENMTQAKAKAFFSMLQKYTSIAYEWIHSYFATGDEHAFFNTVAEYEKVTSQAVQQFVVKHILFDLFTQIEVLPMPKALAPLSEQAKKESDEFDNAILANYHRTAPIEPPAYALTLSGPKALQFSFPKPDTIITLDNGVTVVLRENKRLPLVTLDCRFKNAFFAASSAINTAVNCMMDMLMEGSVGYSKEDNVNFFDRYGTDYYFGASGSGISSLAVGLAEQIDRFVHILTKPAFAQEALEKVKAIEHDAIMRRKDSPQDLAIRMLKSKIYAGHPFGWNFDEALHNLSAVTIRNLTSLHHDFICGNNLIITVVGDFDCAAMEDIIRRSFGTISAGIAPAVVYPSLHFKPNEHIKVPMLRDQVVLALGRPSAINLYHEDAVAIKMLNYIAFSSLGSRLYQLRERSGLFYVAYGTWNSAASKEVGFDYVATVLNPDNVAKVEKQIKELIAQLADHGVTQEEVDAARQLYLKTLIDSISSNGSIASMFGTQIEFGLGVEYFDHVLAKVQQLTVTDLNAVCKKYFKPDGLTTIVIGRV